MKQGTGISWVLALSGLGSITFIGGCNSGSGKTPPQAISVSITPNGAQSVDQGQMKNFTATVSNDASNKGVNWTLTQNGTGCSPGCGSIAPGSTASGASAVYTAPAAVSANIQFNVTATSVADSTKSASDAATAVPPPSIANPAQVPAAVAGQAYSFTLTESGGVAPFMWSITSGSLPPGLTLNSSTGAISGTPTASSAVARALRAMTSGTPTPVMFPFTVKVLDSGSPAMSAQLQLSMAFTPAALTITTTSPLPSGAPGISYSDTLAATGGTGPYTWSLASGSSLPAGLMLSPAGVISGTPSGSGGTTSFSVQVMDSAATPQTATATFSLAVTSLLTIGVPTNLPGGFVGTAYSYTLKATGGTTPYTWSISSGSLPAGLSLDAATGAITGTPPGPAGTTNFTIQVTDSSSPSQSATFGVSLAITTTSCVFDSTGSGPSNYNGNLMGTYAYLFKGFDSSGNAVARVGSFIADGNENQSINNGLGTISSAYEDAAHSGGAGSFTSGALPSSTYCIDYNGHGDLTLGTVKYRILAIPVLGSAAASSVSFIEFDSMDGVRGSGIIKQQTATSLNQNGSVVSYAFGFSGRDDSKGTNEPAAVVGVFAMDATLAAAAGPYGSKGEEDFDDPAVNGSVLPTVNTGISVSLSGPPSSNGRYTGTLTTPSGTGNINFAAYVVTAASDVPTTASPTEMFAVSMGKPSSSVLSGEILSQNFASNSTFANSATPKTPDARALTAPSTAFFVVGIASSTSAMAPLPQSAAAIGFIGYNGNGGLAGTTGLIENVEMDADEGGTVVGPVTAVPPTGATYTVAPDGRTTFTQSAGPIPGLAYLSDVNTGFVIDDISTVAIAGFGRLLPARTPPAGTVPTYGGLIEDLATAIPDSATTVGFVQDVASGGVVTGINWIQDVDSPFSGLTKGVTSPSPLPFTNTDALGRFTVGLCPPVSGSPDVCVVGYEGYGDIIIDETTTGPTLVPAWPSVTVWGGAGVP